jgi:hypothetical protein
VANLGANLWGHSQDGKTASIRAGRIHYQARCQSKHGCKQSAVIQIECRDSINIRSGIATTARRTRSQ